MLKPPYIIYMALLDKFLQITTNFFTRTKKTILHRFLTPHNIVLLYLYFHCFCQRSKQSRHLRIAKFFHQQFGIYSLRYGNLIFFSILSAFFRRSSSIIWPYTSVTMSACACPESHWTALISPPLSFSLYVTLVWRRLWKPHPEALLYQLLSASGHEYSCH